MVFNVVQVSELPGVSDYCKQIFQNTEVIYQFLPCKTEGDTIAAARDADVLIVLPARQPVSRKVIENLPRCRYILGIVTGYDGVDLKAATEHCILVTNMPNMFSEEVADHTMAVILLFSRRILELIQLVKKGEWEKDEIGSRLGREIWPKLNRLQGQTLGIIGFGSIGRSVAVRAKSFGMRLIACDPNVAPVIFREHDVERIDLDRLLSESDFVSVHAFLSKETRGMLGLEQFKKMKTTAYIINTARGPIINREALYIALTQGIIAGAGLDVTEPEPSTPENNQLLSLENVIMTPHSAGHGKVASQNLAREVSEQVFRIIRGEWPRNLVNPEIKANYIRRWR